MSFEFLYKIMEMLSMEIEEIVNVEYDSDNCNSCTVELNSGDQYNLQLSKLQ